MSQVNQKWKQFIVVIKARGFFSLNPTNAEVPIYFNGFQYSAAIAAERRKALKSVRNLVPSGLILVIVIPNCF